MLGVAAVASYESMPMIPCGRTVSLAGLRLVPLTVDGLIYASLSDGDAGLGAPEDTGSGAGRWLLGLGIAATLAANVAHGLGHGPVGAAVAAWHAVALVGS